MSLLRTLLHGQAIVDRRPTKRGAGSRLVDDLGSIEIIVFVPPIVCESGLLLMLLLLLLGLL